MIPHEPILIDFLQKEVIHLSGEKSGYSGMQIIVVKSEEQSIHQRVRRFLEPDRFAITSLRKLLFSRQWGAQGTDKVFITVIIVYNWL